MFTEEFDHQFQTRFGFLLGIGDDPNSPSTFTTTILLDGDQSGTVFDVYCYDLSIKVGDRIEVLTGKSQTTPDGNYCEIGPVKG